MINLNDIFERGDRWHAINKQKQDILFCAYDCNFAPFMNSLALPKQNWINMGYVFIGKLHPNITWDEYVENFHNTELAEFKELSFELMCEKLRQLYVECEGNIKDFNKDKKYSNFRKILNDLNGIRHGKSHQIPATKDDCTNAFREYQSFVK
jgi:hypothetical protein